MSEPIVIPQVGLVDEIILVEWLKADGDHVSAGEAIALLETDKTQTEVEALYDGILRIAVQPGPDSLSPDTVLGSIE